MSPGSSRLGALSRLVPVLWGGSGSHQPAISVPEYQEEQEKDLTNLLLKAGVDRLDKLGGEALPVPRKREKRSHPGKITPNWEDQPETPDGRDLSDLM